MSQTTTFPGPAPAIIRHPAQFLRNLIVTLLAPMFLGVTGGDPGLARMAAIETINAYRAQNLSDLIAIAQIIAYGLAALGSLSLSMADDVSLSMTLRLRGNANACTRSAEQNRRALAPAFDGDQSPYADAMPDEPETPDFIAEAAIPAGQDQFMDDAAANMLAAESLARLLPPPPAKISPVPETAAPISEKRYQQMLAIALVKESGEITDSIPGLPPSERQAAILRAATLSGMASQVLMADGLPAEPGDNLRTESDPADHRPG